MTDDPERQRHWRELAELLGLDPDAPQAAEKPRTAPEPVAPRNDVTIEEVRAEKPRPTAEPVAHVRPPVRQVAESRPEPIPAARAEPTAKEDFEREQPQSTQPSGAREETESARERENIPAPARERAPWDRSPREDDRPRRGKRHRGRRGGPEREDSSAGSGDREGDAEPAHPQHTEDEDGDFGPRGPGRAPELADEDPPEELETPPAADADDEIDEEDTLSDWNVPSWTELISSLYRPER
jgi:hypothetical protein